MTEQDKQKVKFIFSIIGEEGTSKVPIKTFGLLLDISRTTLHSWAKGKNINDRLRLNLAYNSARRLAKAVELGKLPLAADQKMKAAERATLVKQVMLSVAL